MKSMYWRKRFHGVSDEWGSATCLRCNRRINLSRRGQFRKHVASPGAECCGSWEFVDIQKARIEAVEQSVQRTACDCGRKDGKHDLFCAVEIEKRDSARRR